MCIVLKWCGMMCCGLVWCGLVCCRSGHGHGLVCCWRVCSGGLLGGGGGGPGEGEEAAQRVLQGPVTRRRLPKRGGKKIHNCLEIIDVR